MQRISLRMEEEHKYNIIKNLVDHSGNKHHAAAKLHCSIRTVNRLCKIYSTQGKKGFIHGNRDRKPATTFDESIKTKVIDLYQKKFYKFNITHFTEFLASEYHISISKKTVLNWLKSVDNINSLSLASSTEEAMDILNSITPTDILEGSDNILFNIYEDPNSDTGIVLTVKNGKVLDMSILDRKNNIVETKDFENNTHDYFSIPSSIAHLPSLIDQPAFSKLSYTNMGSVGYRHTDYYGNRTVDYLKFSKEYKDTYRGDFEINKTAGTLVSTIISIIAGALGAPLAIGQKLIVAVVGFISGQTLKNAIHFKVNGTTKIYNVKAKEVSGPRERSYLGYIINTKSLNVSTGSVSNKTIHHGVDPEFISRRDGSVANMVHFDFWDMMIDGLVW